MNNDKYSTKITELPLCAAESPTTKQRCTMAKGHFGPHRVGGPYHVVETFVTKCTDRVCEYHQNSRPNIETGGRDRWSECIWCGHILSEGVESNPTNPLEHIFQLQKALNLRCKVDTDEISQDFGENNRAAQQHWVREFSRALGQELAELVDCTDWKWWASYQKFDLQNARVEVVDILHFLVSLAQVLGMSSDDLYQAYLKKHKVNNERQDSGYKEKVDDCRHI